MDKLSWETRCLYTLYELPQKVWRDNMSSNSIFWRGSWCVKLEHIHLVRILRRKSSKQKLILVTFLHTESQWRNRYHLTRALPLQTNPTDELKEVRNSRFYWNKRRKNENRQYLKRSRNKFNQEKKREDGKNKKQRRIQNFKVQLNKLD